jgi:acetyl esterase/lipase
MSVDNWKIIVTIVIIVIIIVFIVSVILMDLQRHYLFEPSKHDASNHYFDTNNEIRRIQDTIRSGIHIRRYQLHKEPTSKVIILCHGTHGNLTYFNHGIEFARMLDLDLITFDYAGYGISPGRPNQGLICTNSLIVHDYASEIYNPNNIIIWGESLGGASAAYLASVRPCDTLILHSTFTSLSDVANHAITVGKIKGFVSYSLWFLYNVVIKSLPANSKHIMPVNKWLKDCRCNIVILHSTEDELIPYWCAERNYEVCKNCTLINMKGDHSSPIISTESILKLSKMINSNIDLSIDDAKTLCSRLRDCSDKYHYIRKLYS